MTLGPRAVRWVRFALGLTVLAAFGLAYLFSEGFRREVDLALEILGRGDVAGLRDYILSFGAWAPIVSALLMVLQALVAPLPAFLLSFANGLAFGVFWGGMLSLASASLAAAVSFSIARFLGRGPAEAIVGRAHLGAADRWFLRWGAYAVLFARLVPVVSFDVVSYAAGLTSMRFWRFMVATVVGMAPATFIYSYFGERAPQYVTILLVVFGVVIAVALVAALLRLREQGKEIPLVEDKETIEEAEVEFDDQTTE
ncbi:MAG: TVP38/TMEM64 family protein [Rubrobacteraceae bacterium]|nr:TVP38/TMEM64 family protein [Rubrobacteraceae bacterium]